MMRCAQNKTEEADRVRRNLAGESRSDHIAIVNAFQVSNLSTFSNSAPSAPPPPSTPPYPHHYRAGRGRRGRAGVQ